MNKSSRGEKNINYKNIFIWFLVFFSCYDRYTVSSSPLYSFLIDGLYHIITKSKHTHALICPLRICTVFFFLALFDMGIHGIIPRFYIVHAEDTWGERRSLFTCVHGGSPSSWDAEALDWNKTEMKARQNPDGRFTTIYRGEKQWNKSKRRRRPHFYSM